MSADEGYDVVIVGGGAAGLSAGVTLSRARRRVLVVDAGAPRNAPADGVHNLLGHEGIAPKELLALGRAEVAGYGGTVIDGEVVAAEAVPQNEFRVRLADGTTARSRRLLVATGLVDELPDVPGLAERWGHDVLHCPYCHGWEVRDQAIGVLATGPNAMHQALLFRQLSDDVVVFAHTGPAIEDEQRRRLAARGIRIVEGTVTAVESGAEGITGLRLESGELVARRAVVVAPMLRARSAVLESLGLEPEPIRMGDQTVGHAVPADPTGRTAVPGVWVAGNVRETFAQVVSSAAAGMMAGAMINADLVEEDTEAALAQAAAGQAQV